MVSASFISKILGGRFENRLDGWLDELRTRITATGFPFQPVLVKIEHATDNRPIPEPDGDAKREELEAALDIKVLRPLGRGEFIVTLNPRNREFLAERGHLSYAIATFRLTAI